MLQVLDFIYFFVVFGWLKINKEHGKWMFCSPLSNIMDLPHFVPQVFDFGFQIIDRRRVVDIFQYDTVASFFLELKRVELRFVGFEEVNYFRVTFGFFRQNLNLIFIDDF